MSSRDFRVFPPREEQSLGPQFFDVESEILRFLSSFLCLKKYTHVLQDDAETEGMYVVRIVPWES